MAASKPSAASDAAKRRRSRHSPGNDTRPAIIRAWFGRQGGDSKPWLIERSDGTIERVAELTLSGTYEGRYNPAGEPSLPESPKAYLELKFDESWKDPT